MIARGIDTSSALTFDTLTFGRCPGASYWPCSTVEMEDQIDAVVRATQTSTVRELLRPVVLQSVTVGVVARQGEERVGICQEDCRRRG